MAEYILSKKHARILCSILEQFGGDLTSFEASQALSAIHLQSKDPTKPAKKISLLGKTEDDIVTLRLNPCDACDQEVLQCAHILQTALDCDAIDENNFVNNFPTNTSVFDSFQVTPGTTSVIVDDPVDSNDNIEFTNVVTLPGSLLSFDYNYEREVAGLRLNCRGNVVTTAFSIQSKTETCSLSCIGNIFSYNITGPILTFNVSAPIERAELTTTAGPGFVSFNDVSFRIYLEDKSCCSFSC